ncbi:response regulator transcription factor [Spirosoma fluminis]
MKHINEVVNHQGSITHLTGASNYTWLHFRNGGTMLLSKPLSSFEILLPAFIRVHKTALVNPKYVHQIKSPARTKTPGSITMQGGAILPISRRRWSQVADSLLEHSEFTQIVTTRSAADEPQYGQSEYNAGVAKQVVTVPNQQVYAMIKDDVKSVLIRQLLEEKWPHCTVRFFANGAGLTDYVSQTASQQLPAMVLLDVRSVNWAGLGTLEQLKSNKQLRMIPTVVFINDQSGNDIEVCYAAGANSVIPQMADNDEFAKVIERICQYWLSFAALPTALLG